MEAGSGQAGMNLNRGGDRRTGVAELMKMESVKGSAEGDRAWLLCQGRRGHSGYAQKETTNFVTVCETRNLSFKLAKPERSARKLAVFASQKLILFSA